MTHWKDLPPSMTCCGDLEHNQSFLVQTFFARHTNRNNTLNCGGQTIKFAVQKVQLSHTSKLSKLRGSNPILRGQKMRYGSKYQICKIVGGQIPFCGVKKNCGGQTIKFALVQSSKLSHLGAQFANDQIRRVKKRQKMRSPGIEPGSITWQATIITTRPRAQLRT